MYLMTVLLKFLYFVLFFAGKPLERPVKRRKRGNINTILWVCKRPYFVIMLDSAE